MSVARKSLITLVSVVAFVTAGAFIAAKVFRGRKPQVAHSVAETPTSKSQAAAKPLFYDAVGTSDPDSSKTQGSQRVTRYTVHVKTLTTQHEAEKLLTELNASGFFGYYTPVRQKDRVLYHVRIGLYANESEASQSLAKLQRKTKIDASVTKLQ